MKKVLFFILAGIFSVCLTSCEPNQSGNGSTDIGGEIYEGTVILAAQQGSTAKRLVVSDEAWVVSNTNTWFSLSAIQGPAGESELGVIAKESNDGLEERVGSFKINQEVVYVVQRGLISSSLEYDEALIGIGQTEVLIPVAGTFPIEEMEVTTDASWAEFVSIDLTEDIEILADGITPSSYHKAAIKFAIKEENNTESNRSANVTIKAGEQTLTASLIQLGTKSDGVDYTKAFFRASVTLKGTGTWCGYCPNMAVQLHETEAEYPDRFYLMNVYNGSPGLTWREGDAIMSHYNIKGYPSGFFNGYAEIPSASGLAQMAESLMIQAVEYYPSNVAIAASSSVSGDDITLEVKLAARKSKEYKITAYIMEDGIVAEQSDYLGLLEDPENYVHDNIVRGTFTDGHIEGGDVIDLPLGQVVTTTLKMKKPADVVDINNTNILVYVTYEGGYNPDVPKVPNASYKDYGYIIDNAVKIKTVGGEIDFRYEE